MAKEDRLPPEFLNKRVPFRFWGVDLVFDLSQQLFSSFDVDRGTRLLLKTLAQHGEPESWRSILDAGCGVGALAVSLARRLPDSVVEGWDRDALAIAVSRANARLNRAANAVFRGDLVLCSADEPASADETRSAAQRRYDLAVSNLPAKAGAPVLSAMIAKISGLSGLAAVVVVAPLADLIERAIGEAGAEVVFREGTPGHVVFHYRGTGGGPQAGGGGEPSGSEEPSSPRDFWQSFVRKRGTFELGPWRYGLATVFGLPDFDTVSHADALATEMLAAGGVPRGESWLFWDPGQGHLPCALAQSKALREKPLVLAGRDLLALETTRRNLEAGGVAPDRITVDHRVLPDGGKTQVLVAALRADQPKGWAPRFARACRQAIEPAGSLVVTGRSTDVGRLVQELRPGAVRADQRRYGFRCVVLEIA